MRKLFALLFLIIIAAVIAFGCAQKKNNETGSGTSAVAIEPPYAAPSPEGEPAVEDESASAPRDMAPAKRADSAEKSAGTPYEPYASRPAVPSQGGLKAAFADDNSQFNAYLEFLSKYKKYGEIYPVSERFIIRVLDKNGKTVPDAVITFSDGAKTLSESKTYANGETLFFPSEYPSSGKYNYTVSYNGSTTGGSFTKDGKRTIEIKLPAERKVPQNAPVDILFVLDTTGSMGEEIERLKNTLLIIHDNLMAMPSKPDIRFGMVMYKDKGDNYVTREIPFTNNAADFQKTIAKINADGGGDTPEDLETAMNAAINKMNWNENGIRLVYLITDAPAHTDYKQAHTLYNSSKSAKTKGVKIFSIGTGGLPLEGELQLRQMAQYTMGKYIFLTYGERGESEGGTPGSVSHHTGSNFTSDKLETIVIKFSKEELNDYMLTPAENGEDYFSAEKSSEDNLKVLGELFDRMIAQLVAYSTISIDNKTTVAVLPVTTKDAKIKASAEYFTEQLYNSAAKYKGWKSVDRSNLDKLLKEANFNLSGLVDEESAIKIGSMSGAEILITGDLYKKDGSYELYLKMLRSSNGEVLSVTRGKLDEKLGL